MIRDLISDLCDLRGEDPLLNARIIKWLGRHLGWDMPSLQPHFYGLSGDASGAIRLTQAWHPGAAVMFGWDREGKPSAALVPLGAPAPIVAYAPNPANALLAANFRAYAIRQARDAAQDDARLLVAA